MSSELKNLISRLNPLCRRALETAAALCVSQTHYNVEVEHYLLKLLDLPGSDLEPVLNYYEIEPNKLVRQLSAATEAFDRGNSRTPAMSPQIVRLLREGWMQSSLHLGETSVRSGALLLALFEDETLRGVVLESCPMLAKVPRDRLRDELGELIRDSSEGGARAGASRSHEPSERSGSSGGSGGSGSDPTTGDEPATEGTALSRYTIDLIAEAKEGRIDPIRGRGSEIRQVIDILTRRRQNNPILVGDAGVGKTAIAEGFALRVVAGDVPAPLKEIALRTLDLGLLQAGAGIKGEFEERLKGVIAEVKGSKRPVILFIDEAHTLIGAGGSEGQGDAANLLKPALARGEVRTIAATTWSEYKKYFEKDSALARRFQLIKVEEPDEEAALDMLRGIAPNLERHHGVRILDSAVRDAVSLSQRFLSERRLPDKAISVLDTACARVALAQEATPPQIEDIQRRMRRTQAELDVLAREGIEGARRGADEETLTDSLAALESERQALSDRWQTERELVGEIRALQAALDLKDSEAPAATADPERLAGLLAQHAELTQSFGQEGDPIVPISVDSRIVAAVIASWTGIPAGRMLADEVHSVLTLEERLAHRIIGQPQALDALCRRVSTSRAGLEDPAKPKGVFLLAGPTGVGKTETAHALADLLFGGERNLVSVNMSEFQEAHSVATLKGSPPGYVGYGKGGVLTEAVRRKPYSVVLLDEVEKAHPDVLELFYQVFDKGVLEDGEGVPVDFKHTVILLTTNLGDSVVEEVYRQSEGKPEAEPLLALVRQELGRHFRPALLGRLVVVPYHPLGEEEILAIVQLKLERVRERVLENHLAELTYDAALVQSLTERCLSGSSGARDIDHLLTQTLLPELSARILAKMAANESFERIHIAVDKMGRFT